MIATAHLALTPVAAADAPELHAIFSDPRSWWYDPGRRHADLATTVAWCQRAAARWDRDGLSYWTARDRESGEVVGVGGAQRQASGNWNLNYRIAPDRQRRGLASELAGAALHAARARDPDVAFIAWIDPHNAPSMAVARRLGLTDQGPRTDPSDGERRIAFADRPLES